MKQVDGLANCPGTYIVYALDWRYSDRSGVVVNEQMRTKTVSIVKTSHELSVAAEVEGARIFEIQVISLREIP
jgi:hypothetical protein